MKHIIRLNGILLPITHSQMQLNQAAVEKLRVPQDAIKSVKPIKKSVDARHKPHLKFNYSLAVEVETASGLAHAEPYIPGPLSLQEYLHASGYEKKCVDRPAVYIAGSGPAGLFAALTLAEAGLSPVILERGDPAALRMQKIKQFENGGALDPESNVQFGEGGAGTFSDGKLNTGIKSDLLSVILGEFIAAGAPAEIAYLSKPHIGTDRLVGVVSALRKKIIERSGRFLFGTKLQDLRLKNGKLSEIILTGAEAGSLPASVLILATGHSARDTYEMLYRHGLPLERKPFAVGVRIEHLQSFIDRAMYGGTFREVGAADYKLAAPTTDGRGCFSFCMCPGGYVTAAASEPGHLNLNGMSRFRRDGNNANAALLVGVRPEDFGEGSALAGIDFQRQYERLAYESCKNFRAPVQNARDFLKDKVSDRFYETLPTYPIGTGFCDLSACLPAFAVDGLKEGLVAFERKIKGFAATGLLSGVEMRSSAPVRILRDDAHQTAIEGLFAAGEGAGYAGGIMSAAVDGIKTALMVLKKYY